MDCFFTGGLMEVWWHHTCYSWFTDKSKLNQLRNSIMLHVQNLLAQTPQFVIHQQGIGPSSRWLSGNCVCLSNENSTNIHNVSTLELSEKILSLAPNDVLCTMMRVHLANVEDLVAAEGKYHLQCWVEFDCRIKITASGAAANIQAKDTYMDLLCVDILTGLSRGHVYNMLDVWRKCQILCQHHMCVRSSNPVFEPKTFYEDIEAHWAKS